MNTLKITFQGLMVSAVFWLAIWAMSYIACVGTYHSSVCKQDMTSQIIIKVLHR